MYENKFGNLEWEQTLDENGFPRITNEYKMVNELSIREDENIDSEALSIFLNKYFYKWMAGCYKYCKNLDYYFDIEKCDDDYGIYYEDEDGEEYECNPEKDYKYFNYYDKSIDVRAINNLINNLSGSELELYQIFDMSHSALEKFFKASENQLKFPNEFIKFMEIKTLTSLLIQEKIPVTSYKDYGYNNYGKFSSEIGRVIRFILNAIESPVDYDAVKNGTFENKPLTEPNSKISSDVTNSENKDSDEKSETTKKNSISNKEEAPAEPSKKRFWKDWSTGKKVLFVLINMATYCVPLILYLIIRILKKQLLKK